MWHSLRLRIEHVLFDAPRSRGPAEALRVALRFLYALVRDLLDGQLNLHAMGLVYATLLAIVPLLAFSFAILRAFGTHRGLEPLIFEFFRPMGAAAGPLTRQVMDFAENVRAGVIGSVGLALLVWTLLGTLKKVENSLNFVWHVSVARGFARRVAEYISLLVIGPLLVVAVISLSKMALRETALPALNSVALSVAPFAIVTLLFALVYKLVPNTKVRWWAAFAGGLASGVAWTVTGKLFTAFVVLSARMTMVYAGLAIGITALVWTYVGWLVLLLGAQLSFYAQNPAYLRIGLTEPRLSNSDVEQLTLSIMYLVGRQHADGSRRWTVESLAARLHLPGILVARCVDALEEAGLILSTENGQLAPARDLDAVRVVDVLDVARTRGRGPRSPLWSPPPAVAALCTELDDGWRARCGDRTLRALLDSAVAPAPAAPALAAPARAAPTLLLAVRRSVWGERAK